MNKYMKEYRKKNPDSSKNSSVKHYAKNREAILEKKRNAPSGYNSWKSMRQRCMNSNRDDYKYYGGKGIIICSEWDSFEQFISDMGDPPTKKHTIERKDNSKGYFPENCKWATRKEQSINTSHAIIVDGISMSEWSRKLKCNLGALIKRYRKYGKKCLVKNFKPNGIEFNSEINTLKEWAVVVGISGDALRRRINEWGLKKALTTKKYETRIGNTNWIKNV